MQKIIEKMKSFSKDKKKLFYGIIAIVFVIILVLILHKNNNGQEIITAKLGDFKNQVSVSGKVVPASSVSLGFKNSGLITNIYYNVDDFAGNKKIVRAGALIAQIDARDALKDVHDAEINLENAKLALAKSKLENSDENMNADLQKAYDDGFISVSDTFLDLQPTIDGLEDILNETNLSDNASRVSGSTAQNYRDNAESLYYKAKNSFEKNKINFRVLDRNSSKSDIEKIINDTYDTTKIFMDAIKNMRNFVDYMAEDTGRATEFATSKSSLYEYTNTINEHLSDLLSIKTSIKNYQDAFKTTDLDVQGLELTVKQKENTLREAEAKLGDYYIRAPFDGIITKIDAKIGELATSNAPLVTMMSEGTFQIESFVPEVSIAKLIIGQEADIILDAYGEDTLFKAKVISIDPAETLKDGVSTYKVKFQFIEKDERIKSGMTASVLITAFKKENVIVLPEGVIFEENGVKFVQVKKNDKILDVEIKTGNVSSLGQVEITSGVVDGDIIILNPSNTLTK